jgi:NAD(P)-dependent dehydrogenase (short-subunit alcohol dehydrogenase family)
MKSFERKVAAITGAASGIGRALALELAARGAELALVDVDEEGLAHTALEAAGRGAKVTRARVDVADRAAVLAWADRVVTDHGRVNLIVNNAGVSVSARVLEITWEDFDWLMGINFWGVIHGTKAFLPHLIASGEGHVVNVSSVFGIIGVPGQSAYNAAKFGVRGFTEALRQELAIDGHPVSATCVHPGGIKTQIVRNARIYETGGGPTAAEAHEQFDRAARTSPEDAARTILAGVKRDARRVLVGMDARAIDAVQRLFPTGYQAMLAAAAKRGSGGF